MAGMYMLLTKIVWFEPNVLTVARCLTTSLCTCMLSARSQVVRSSAFESEIIWLAFSRKYGLLMRIAATPDGALLCVDSEALGVHHSLVQDAAEGDQGLLIGSEGVQLGCNHDVLVLVEARTGRFSVLELADGLPELHQGCLTLPIQLRPRVWLAGEVPWCTDTAVALELGCEANPLQSDLTPQIVSCNEQLTVIVGNDGAAWFVGDSSFWGAGLQGVCTKLPMMVPGSQGLSIKCCALGQDHSLFVTTTGAVFSAGSGRHGELGRRHKAGRLPQVASEIRALRGSTVVSAACGSARSAVVTATGELMMFGRPLLRSHHLQHKRSWLLEPV